MRSDRYSGGTNARIRTHAHTIYIVGWNKDLALNIRHIVNGHAELTSRGDARSCVSRPRGGGGVDERVEVGGEVAQEAPR